MPMVSAGVEYGACLVAKILSAIVCRTIEPDPRQVHKARRSSTHFLTKAAAFAEVPR